MLRALALTFAAEADRAAGTVARAPWDQAVAAWEGVGDPYRLGQALIGAAEAAAADGDRPAAAAQVRRAVEIADGWAPARCGNRPNSSPAGPASPWPATRRNRPMTPASRRGGSTA